MDMMKKRGRKHKRGKTVVAREAGFSIRAKGRGFIVQIRREGIRETKYFADLASAKLHCQALNTKRTNEGLAGFSLSVREREDARGALKLLAGRASLMAAAKEWLRLNPAADAVTVAQLFERHVADIRSRNRREKTIQARRQFLNRFAADYGTRAASSVTTEEAEQWLNVRVPERTFNTMRFCLGAAFGFAVKQRWIDSNPIVPIDQKQFERGEPLFWPVEKVSAFLRAAAEFQPQLVPYFALCAFSGVRPFEASRLDWANVNIEEALFRIPATISKVKRTRLVPIEKNLIEWLMPYRRASGRVAAPDMTIRRWRRRLAAVTALGRDEVASRLAKHKTMKGTAIKEAGYSWDGIISAAEKAAAPMTLYPADVLRHCYATYWMAVHSHEGRLAEIMGNSPRIIQIHYKGLATKKEGEKYFALMPPAQGAVIEWRAAAG